VLFKVLGIDTATLSIVKNEWKNLLPTDVSTIWSYCLSYRHHNHTKCNMHSFCNRAVQRGTETTDKACTHIFEQLHVL